MKGYIIGIDIGTQGTKAALTDLELRVISTAFEPSKLLHGHAGEIWQEPEDIFQSCVRTMKELTEKSGINGKDVLAIGVDSQMAGIMGIDKKGEASTWYDSWLDTRCSQYASLLEKEAGPLLLSHSGGPVTCSHAAKILWWKNQRPDIWKRTAGFVLPHGYVIGKMTGNHAEKAVFDYTCLHFNNFSDNREKRWNESALRQFGVDLDKLPRIGSPFEIVGTTTEAFARKTGLVSGIPVAAGLGDSAASAFGSGMFDRGQLLDCAGTASVLCSVVDSYVPDSKNRTLVMMRSPIDGFWMPLSYIGGGGMCIRWFRDQLTGKVPMNYDRLEEEASLVAPGCEGLLFCPHFSGRVLPPDPQMKGAFEGLDFKHTRAHLYRSVLEAIAYEYAMYLDILRNNYTGTDFGQLTSVGGGARCGLFNQIKADVMHVTVRTCETGETALIGSAAVAGMAAGLLQDYRKSIHESIRTKAVFAPGQENRNIYDLKSKEYRCLMERMAVEKGGETACRH